jgi:hypothetical protein
LCVYYRDSDRQNWQSAVNNCANGTNVDAADRSYAWRLPNVAELGQLYSTTATWVPYYSKLTSVVGADPRTTNMLNGYFSATSYIDHDNTTTNYALGNTPPWMLGKVEGRLVRCVRTIIN